MPARDRGRRVGGEAHPTVEALDCRVLLSAAPDFSITLPTYAVYSQQSDSVEVTVTRRDRRGTAQAEVTTDVGGVATGTATPGVQYQPIDQTVTFRPGQSTQTVSIPVIVGAPNPGQVTLGVSVKGQKAGSTWQSGTLTLAEQSDVTRPKVVSGALVTIKGAVQGVRLAFNEPMDPAEVQNPANYAVVGKTSNGGLSGMLGGLGTALSSPSLGNSQATSKTGPISLKVVAYDPATQTAFLVFSKTLKTNVQIQISGKYLGPRGSQAPPVDTQGNPLENFAVTVSPNSTIKLSAAARANLVAKRLR